MLNHPTLDQLKDHKLIGMADAFVELQAQDQAADLGHAEWLALLLDSEAASRSTKRVNTRLRSAKLRHIGASVEDVDYRSRRQLDKALFQQLATCKWIKDHRHAEGVQGTTPTDHRSLRHRQNLAGLCTRPEGLPA